MGKLLGKIIKAVKRLWNWATKKKKPSGGGAGTQLIRKAKVVADAKKNALKRAKQIKRALDRKLYSGLIKTQKEKQYLVLLEWATHNGFQSDPSMN